MQSLGLKVMQNLNFKLKVGRWDIASFVIHLAEIDFHTKHAFNF